MHLMRLKPWIDKSKVDFEWLSDNFFTINTKTREIAILSNICAQTTANIEVEKILRKKGYPGVLNKERSKYKFFPSKYDSDKFFDSNI